MSIINSLVRSAKSFHSHFILIPMVDLIISQTDRPEEIPDLVSDQLELTNKQYMLAKLTLKYIYRAWYRWNDILIEQEKRNIMFHIAQDYSEDSDHDAIMRYENAREYGIDRDKIDAAARFLRERR